MTMFKKKKKKKKSHRICNAIDAVQRNRRVHETVNAGYIRTLKEEEEKEEEIDDSSGNQMCIAVGQRPWHTIRRINDFTGNKVLHPITVGHGWLIHDIALTFDQHTSSLEIIANFVPTLFHRQKNIRLETRKVWRGRQQLFPHMLFSHTPPPSPLLSSRWVTQQPIWRHIHSKSHQNPVFLTNNNRGGGNGGETNEWIHDWTAISTDVMCNLPATDGDQHARRHHQQQQQLHSGHCHPIAINSNSLKTHTHPTNQSINQIIN